MSLQFGVYLHWPFCSAKCPYCDFNSHVRTGGVDEESFSFAFEKEMSYMRSRTGKRNITSIFIGGGTPSLMHPKTVGSLLDSVDKYWGIAENIEITLESNPSSVEVNRLREYKKAGVNRISLGVQALNNEDLAFLGRIHNVEDALYAMNVAKDLFPSFSFDLIYALPHQTLEQWSIDLKKALGYARDHLSLYQLTIEEGTHFHKLYHNKKITMPAPAMAEDFYKITQAITNEHGFPAYEISNHAKIGKESIHNLTYWRYHEYVGIGPGAHGRFYEDHYRVATIAEKQPEKWLDWVQKKGSGTAEEEILTSSQEGDEFLLMGLRLVEGVDPLRYENITGHKLSSKKISMLQEQGLLEIKQNNWLAATPAGMVLLDSLVADLAFHDGYM